jgi:hypothetical protein
LAGCATVRKDVVALNMGSLHAPPLFERIKHTPVKLHMITRPSPIENILRWREKNPDLYKQKKLSGIRNSQKIKNAARIVSFKYREKATIARLALPKFQKGEQHFRSSIWRFRSPKNVVYEFKNLAEFLRTHGNLFDIKDLQWKRFGTSDLCNAYKCLSGLRPHLSNGTPKQKVAGSWKGWRWYASKEVEEKL